MSFEVEEVGLRRGGKQVLENVSATLPRGCRIALCGPNGAGKSSLLALLAGDLKATAGTVRLDDRPVRRWKPLELARRRAVLVQQTELLHPFRMEQVVGLTRPAQAANGTVEAARIRAGTDALLDELGLAALRGRRYTELSGGEQRLVQLARVLRQSDAGAELDGTPGWLLLDEPVSHLDLGMTQCALDAVNRRVGTGCGVIAVFHDLELASRWADRMLILAKGALLADAAPEEALEEQRVASAWQVRVRVRPDGEGGVQLRLLDREQHDGGGDGGNEALRRTEAQTGSPASPGARPGETTAAASAAATATSTERTTATGGHEA